MKDYLIDHLDEDKRLNFQNTIDVYNLDRELDFFNFNKKDHVLDAGCGNGNVLEKLNMKGISNIHGIDLSDDRVRQAKERFKSEKNINIMMRPLEQTGFAEASYDKVLCRYIFEHVLCPKNVLTELHRILKPGGSLYISMIYFSTSILKMMLLISSLMFFKIKFLKTLKLEERYLSF